MWETYELGNEDLLWAGIAFNGGIAGQQEAPCGAVSASAVSLGLRYRCPLSEKQQAKQGRQEVRQDARELVRGFIDRFGSITCRDLIGYDFSDPESYRRFQESGTSRNSCDTYVEFAIEKLYELDEKRSGATVQQKVVVYTMPDCQYCAAAKKDLEERGVAYEEINIEGNQEVIEKVKQLSGGTGIVPVLVSGDEVTVGFGGG